MVYPAQLRYPEQAETGPASAHEIAPAEIGDRSAPAREPKMEGS